jgi:hypothetical protein
MGKLRHARRGGPTGRALGWLCIPRVSPGAIFDVSLWDTKPGRGRITGHCLIGGNQFLPADGESVTAAEIAEHRGGNKGEGAEGNEGLVNSVNENHR